LLGRRADATEIDGVTILPLDIQLALFDPYGVVEFQVVRDAEPGVLTLKIESEGYADAMAVHLSEELGVPVRTSEVETGTLPRSAFKPRRVEA
jgi:phenylacetate-CoA ligase